MKITLITSEYKTDQAPHGGVPTLVDGVYGLLSSNPANQVNIVSTRSWRKSELHRRLFNPSTWFKPIGTRAESVNGIPVTYVGSNWSELELMRYRTNDKVKALLSNSELVIGISGTPLFFGLLRGIPVKTIGYYATFISDERKTIINSYNFSKKLLGIGLLNILSIFEKRSLRIPDVVCGLTSLSVERAIQFGAMNAFVLPPSTDETFFDKELLPVDSNSGYLLCVSRLNDPRKNLQALVDSYFRSRSEFGLNRKLVIAGSGELPQKIQIQIKNSRHGEHIQVINNPSSQEIAELCMKARLQILPSFEEGFGIVLVEAMACGVPFLATETVGASEIQNVSGIGALVELGNNLVEELASKMFEYSLAELSYSQRKLIKEAYLTNFSNEVISERLNHEIDKLMSL